MEKYEFKDKKIVPDEILKDKYSKNKKVPIVIDNGAYMCRAGFAESQVPHRNLFKFLISSYFSTSFC